MVFDTRNTADDVLLNSTLQSSFGAVSSFDQSDFHRFHVGAGSGSPAYISLNGLKADADMVLMNADGKAIAASRKTGNSPEAIKASLAAGTYYLQISQRSGNTAYTLNISSNPLFEGINDNVKFVTGDFNGDGWDDLIRQEQGSLINGVSDTQVYMGRNDNRYSAGVDITNMGAVAGNVANLIADDFNGDGRDDLLRQEFGAYVNGVNDVQILDFKNGNFQVAANMADMAVFNGNYTNLIASDLNQDGRADLIRQEKGAWVNGQNDVQIYLSTGGWNFSPVQVGSHASMMTGNDAQLIARGADIMRLELGKNVNGVNDVNFTSFVNGSLTAFQLAPPANFTNASVTKPWKAPIASLYQANATALGNLKSDQKAIASPQGTTGRFSAYERGGIYWSEKTGAIVVLGEMNIVYASQFGSPAMIPSSGVTPSGSSAVGSNAVSSNWLGLPTGQEKAWNGGIRQDFEGGYLFRDATQVVALRPNELPRVESPVGKFRAEYFNNNSLSGQPTFTRVEDAVNTNWGAGGPGNQVGNDNFSVRWTGKFNFESGNYRFSNGVDDGMRVWVDGKLVHNSWVVRNTLEASWNVAMTAGLHDIKVEYREDGGMAMARMDWTKFQPSATNPPEVRMMGQNLDYSRGTSWVSSNGHKFEFQSDGNVVLYNKAGTALWATGTANTNADRFSIQADGNVVLYNGNQAVWASNTSGNPGSRFVVQDDGNVVIYGSNGAALFNTGTVGDQKGTWTASLIWTNKTNPTSPTGNTGDPFADAISRVGGTSFVGTKIGSVHAWGGGQVQDFKDGPEGLGILMQANGSSKAYWISGAFLNFYYNKLDGAAGPLGYPTSDRYVSSDGLSKQDFQYGNIVKNAQGAYIESISPNSPVKLAPRNDLATINAKFDEFAQLNSSVLGSLHKPTHLWYGSSYARHYENASLVWEKGKVEFRPVKDLGHIGIIEPPITPPITPPSPSVSESTSIDYVWQNYQGTLGSATSSVLKFNDQVSYQYFQNGSIVQSNRGTYPLYGAIRGQYLAQNGLNGWLGVPTSAEMGLGGGVIRQDFANGYVRWDGAKATAYSNNAPLPSPEPNPPIGQPNPITPTKPQGTLVRTGGGWLEPKGTIGTTDTREIKIQGLNNSRGYENATLADLSPDSIQNRETWIVIHGMDGNPEQEESIALARAVEGQNGADQVFVLDWRDAANSKSLLFGLPNPSFGASWIERVAEFTVQRLVSWGIDSDKINVIGHSLGAYVGYEISKKMKGGINKLVALDPAVQTLRGYDDEAVKFNQINPINQNQYIKRSWAFYSTFAGPISFGSEDRANTAHASFKMAFDTLSPEYAHGAVRNAFASMLKVNNAGNADWMTKQFRLGSMEAVNKPWVEGDKFEASLTFTGSNYRLTDMKTTRSQNTYDDNGLLLKLVP